MEIQVGTKLSAAQAFRLAIAEARKGLGFVEPNPAVGCVILDAEDRLLSTGYHARFGEPHAEVMAIQNVKDKTHLKGAKVFVTLEPCAHFGKTPPCADLLVRFPLGEVHYGMVDPDPRVAGKGLEILRKNQIQVHPAPENLIPEIESLLEIFLTNKKLQEPFVQIKVASP